MDPKRLISKVFDKRKQAARFEAERPDSINESIEGSEGSKQGNVNVKSLVSSLKRKQNLGFGSKGRGKKAKSGTRMDA
jgi:hypothetical protein